MPHLLGIDLGTSSVKAIVIDEQGRVTKTGAHEYPIQSPRSGWAEQDTGNWWNATVSAVRQATADTRDSIKAIGLSGQMHGVVLIDVNYQPTGPAIIWADQRSAAEVKDMLTLVGRERLAHVAGTAPAVGFMGPTLLWLKKHDPARLDRAHTCLLPKDTIRLRLTGQIATDTSDASATALFDVQRRQWSTEICEILGLPTRLLPPILESADVAGTLIPSAAEALGLRAGVPVVAGCADQVAQAVGNGLLDPGNGSVTVGSGGQVFIPLNAPLVDEQLRLHIFCHAPANHWYILGAMLTAGLSLRWLRDLLGLTGDADAYRKLSALAAGVSPGADGLLFLPYMAGERAPIMDPLARGCFVGLTLQHGRGHMARAIMEGVALALRQIIDVIQTLNAPVNNLLAVGNGLASPIWRQITADILDRPLHVPSGREQTGVGAALLAGIGAGVYSDYGEARATISPPAEITEPLPEHCTYYVEHQERFAQLYPTLKPVLHDLSASQTKQPRP